MNYQELMENIRESRLKMSKACDHDTKKYIAFLKSLNEKYADQIALFQKRRIVAYKDPTEPVAQDDWEALK